MNSQIYFLAIFVGTLYLLTLAQSAPESVPPVPTAFVNLTQIEPQKPSDNYLLRCDFVWATPQISGSTMYSWRIVVGFWVQTTSTEYTLLGEFKETPNHMNPQLHYETAHISDAFNVFPVNATISDSSSSVNAYKSPKEVVIIPAKSSDNSHLITSQTFKCSVTIQLAMQMTSTSGTPTTSVRFNSAPLYVK